MLNHLRFFMQKKPKNVDKPYTTKNKLTIMVVESGTKCQKVGNSMFIGEYKHNLDAKGRMIIPVKFREQFGASMIVTRGLDGCLTVYSLIQWNQILDQLKKLPSTKRESRMYMHVCGHFHARFLAGNHSDPDLFCPAPLAPCPGAHCP